ncbi:hypothetical protein [Marivita geojedonensis]|uniref:Uncharacterized protein n=1 Tax=Marivita geojedonensis TaxID=1123756 RepID=A0A1X4NEA5_9RHOB|nr:hypothetical protein [Marivita geojedonensis]OSQ45273.1 hypothetical protein MGEO_18305 [Marivita geojedonensis]PRY73897.1 hypothetical protein CLV76_12618 [Marivita geojedonensis]
MPKSLDLDRLKQFEPSKSEPLRNEHETRQPYAMERWPSREASIDGQISIKGPMTTIQRFKALCKEDRRTYADMLDILITHFEGKQ